MTTKIGNYTSEQLKAMSAEMREVSDAPESFNENGSSNERGETATRIASKLRGLAKDLTLFEGGFKSAFLKGLLSDIEKTVAWYDEFKAQQ